MSLKEQDILYERLYRVGRAIGVINGNNTHSGNLSMRDPVNRDRFYITASGSQCGALIPQDIVPLTFRDVSWGDGRASTESTIHRRVLSLPGVNSVVHAHFINTAVISFDTREKRLFLDYLGEDEKGREEFLFRPLDLEGTGRLGGVRVGSYDQPVGSAEMEERIPAYLKEDKLTIVRGHGSFVRAASPEEALHLMTVLETSAEIAIHLRRRGMDVVQTGALLAGRKAFPHRFPRFEDQDHSRREVSDETVIDDFRQRLVYNYENRLSAFGSGSMSQKISAGVMIYCPLGAVPAGFDFPLIRSDLNDNEADSLDLRLHKLIYRETHQNTCMITVSPLATAEGTAVLRDLTGENPLTVTDLSLSYGTAGHPVIKPIDAEAIYLNPRLGLVDPGQLGRLTKENPILNMLRWHKGCCVVAGYGVISTGETTLEQAAHNASSAERIARFRAEVFINEQTAGGPPVSLFEP